MLFERFYRAILTVPSCYFNISALVLFQHFPRAIPTLPSCYSNTSLMLFQHFPGAIPTLFSSYSNTSLALFWHFPRVSIIRLMNIEHGLLINFTYTPSFISTSISDVQCFQNHNWFSYKLYEHSDKAPYSSSQGNTCGLHYESRGRV